MRTTVKETAIDRRVVLSTLWIVLMFNYLYCDVLGLNDPEHLIAIQSGVVAGIDFTPEFLVAAGVLMQIPIALVLLSRVLRYRANRWSNIIAAILMTVVQISTLLFAGPSSPSYLFFSAIEIALLLFITGYAWRWTLSRTTTLPIDARQRKLAASGR